MQFFAICAAINITLQLCLLQHASASLPAPKGGLSFKIPIFSTKKMTMLVSEKVEKEVKAWQPPTRLRNLRFWRSVVTIYGSYKLHQARLYLKRTLENLVRTNKGVKCEEQEVETRKEATDWHRLHEKNSDRMLHVCLSLRGFYLKTGQFLATRHDFMPIEYTSKLAQLQDNVPAMPETQVRRLIEAELAQMLRDHPDSSSNHTNRDNRGDAKGSLIDQYFEWLDLSQTIGSASVAQVHRGRLRHTATQLFLPPTTFTSNSNNNGYSNKNKNKSKNIKSDKSNNGNNKMKNHANTKNTHSDNYHYDCDSDGCYEVAVKIQNPTARSLMSTDLRNLQRLAHFLRTTNELGVDIASAVSELAQQIHHEFNFQREAQLLQYFQHLLVHTRTSETAICRQSAGVLKLRVSVPTVLMGSEKMLVMSFERGNSLVQLAKQQRLQPINNNDSNNNKNNHNNGQLTALGSNHKHKFVPRFLQERVSLELLRTIGEVWAIMLFAPRPPRALIGDTANEKNFIADKKNHKLNSDSSSNINSNINSYKEGEEEKTSAVEWEAGVFHADPHPGNFLLYLPGAMETHKNQKENQNKNNHNNHYHENPPQNKKDNTLTVLDWGQVKRLPHTRLARLAALVLAIRHYHTCHKQSYSSTTSTSNSNANNNENVDDNNRSKYSKINVNNKNKNNKNKHNDTDKNKQQLAAETQVAQCFLNLGFVLSKPHDTSSVSRLALTMFDTKQCHVSLIADPFADTSALRDNQVRHMPSDMFFVLRSVQILRGLAAALDRRVSETYSRIGNIRNNNTLRKNNDKVNIISNNNNRHNNINNHDVVLLAPDISDTVLTRWSLAEQWAPYAETFLLQLSSNTVKSDNK